MLVDSHAHLEGEKYAADREAVLERAAAAGVEAILCIGNGENEQQLSAALDLARSSAGTPQLFASTGIHPHEADAASPALYDHMNELAKDPLLIAWGEIGLDYYYDHSPREVQKEVFIKQMELAHQAARPIIIHCRPSDDSTNAWDDTLQMLRDHWRDTGLGGILHCFTGEWEHAAAALELGFLVSFAGNVTFPKAENIREVARKLPLEAMLVETDSPFLAPVPHRGKRNEPALVAETAAYIANLRGVKPDEIAQATTQNFYRFFGLSARMTQEAERAQH